MSSPALEILVRDLGGVAIWNGPPFTNNKLNTKLAKVPCTSAELSKDGSKLLVIDLTSISIYDGRTLKRVHCINRTIPAKIVHASLSPCGTYLQTHEETLSPQETLSPEETLSPQESITIWKTESEKLEAVCMTPTSGPTIRFSSDEAVAYCVAKDEVQIFFDTTNFCKGVVRCIEIPGVASAELSKEGAYVAAFVPDPMGKQGRIEIYACAPDSQSKPVASRSIFQCSSVKLHWNNGSTGLLIKVKADENDNIETYHGEAKLYYMTVDGSQNVIVPLCKKGPVHDVQWSCSGNEFAVVYGVMPAMVTIFDNLCNRLLELGSGPYNTIHWNPHGKYIMVAGSEGQMALWDYAEEKHLESAKSRGSLITSGWSPDGQYFMIATKLQVDTWINIFHANGKSLFEDKFELFEQVEWKAGWKADPAADIAEPAADEPPRELSGEPIIKLSHKQKRKANNRAKVAADAKIF